VPRYFKDGTELEGKIINITHGYSKSHIKREGNIYKIVDRDGKPILDNEFPDHDSAKVAAGEASITIQDWPEILEYHAKAATEAEDNNEAFDPFGS
jgi:hypothetical protein